MTDSLHVDNNTKAGTIGGTLLVVLLNIFAGDFIRTIGFAALGATVSFFVSLGWKKVINFIDKKTQNRDENTAKKS